MSTVLEAVIKNHIFVGVADLDSSLSMIQHQTKLYLVNHSSLAYVVSFFPVIDEADESLMMSQRRAILSIGITTIRSLRSNQAEPVSAASRTHQARRRAGFVSLAVYPVVGGNHRCSSIRFPTRGLFADCCFTLSVSLRN